MRGRRWGEEVLSRGSCSVLEISLERSLERSPDCTLLCERDHQIMVCNQELKLHTPRVEGEGERDLLAVLT